ncbi:MAG: metallophosphoesterase [Acutalibacteraceae bacterium]|nr:metallophosphoesterase [Acutalibacteraceae bacterium]
MSEELFYCYENDIKTVAQKLSAAKSDDTGYIFITDLHNGAYLTKDEDGNLTGYQDPEWVALREARMIKQLEAVATIAKDNDSIDFICVGGDMINGYETASNAREIAAGQITRQLDPLKAAGKPIFVLMGNHDDGSFHRIYYPWGGEIKPEIVFSDKYWKEHFLTPYIPEGAVFDSEYEYSKYYYYDILKNGKTTRIVALDTFDARLPFDSEGNVTACTRDMLRYGHSQNELKWLAREVLTPDFDGDVIFLCHIGMNNEINFDNNFGGEELTALLDAFQNKLVFFDDELGIEVDYTENKGKILSYHLGHMHSELVYYDPKTKIASIATGTATTNGGQGSPGRENCPAFTLLSRGWANEKEPCFDVMLVSRDRLLKFNVGAGFDAEIEY